MSNDWRQIFCVAEKTAARAKGRTRGLQALRSNRAAMVTSHTTVSMTERPKDYPDLAWNHLV